MLGKIRDEGLQRSQVMEHIVWLSDIYGPRLTGSPAIKQASTWAQKKFQEWGLANIHEEEWPFGKGWSLVRFDAHMTEPQVAPLIGYPKSWTPGTQGRINAEVALANIRNEADIEKYRGKLKGKIVLTQPARAVRMLEDRLVLRMNDTDIKEAMTTPIPPARQAGGGRGGGAAAGGGDFARLRELQTKVQKFFLEEGVAAIFERGSDGDLSAGGSDLSWQTQHTDGGTIFVQSGGPRDAANAGKVPPQVVLAVEHYNRMVRILERNLPVKVELNIQAEFHEEAASKGFNVIAEIPGSDLANEVVMIGAHFDSHHSGTGATDNATGSAAMMEALRILKAVGAKPRRTIRIGLWGGEEEGLLGSRAYVKEHFADPTNMQLKPDHAKLAAYFNLDNGTGHIRGVWSQGNLAAMKVFEQWADPLRDLGVTIISPRSVTSTDHLSFEAVGLPGFQFVQERLEYNSRTHHSNMDVVDHVVRDEMVQVATVAAVFAYNAAMRNEKLPRKALPGPSRNPREQEN
ncbi:MAG: M20/M25/M40 family metallo-hydrolase [Acidobacteria bacterium]|nr:M20/M25/M40 family metallo-hydrolase [Acidobacteriota bacterium]MBI3426873.1 M20/M25/M40 family metallo-hydrolase [Acidobacteriota bacterium]